MPKRNILEELVEGVDAMRDHREGKSSFRTHVVEAKPPPPVEGKFTAARDARQAKKARRS